MVAQRRPARAPRAVDPTATPPLPAGDGGGDLQRLLRITAQAARMKPPRLVSSIFGPPRDWVPPYRRFSEYQMLDLWRPARMLRYVLNVSLPSLPFAPPPFGPQLLNELFWQPSVVLQRPDHEGSCTSFPAESWFFVNGIMTNSAVAQLNAAHLSWLFHRPVTLLQNATAGLIVDLLQCAVGKQWRRITEPAVKAMPAIYDALKRRDKQRVVVIAHSQGTIIMATVLGLLCSLTRPAGPMRGQRAARVAQAPPEFIYPSDAPIDLRDFAPLEEAELAKMEVYCFATCADEMRWFRPPAPGRRPVPWIEHFGNEHDVVARLGMLAPQAARHGIHIDGVRWRRAAAWGHLLDEHYLYPIEQAQRQGRKRGGRGGAAPFAALGAPAATAPPRLYAYINGGEPAAPETPSRAAAAARA